MHKRGWKLVAYAVAAAALSVAGAPRALAGGIGRPNVISARAFGWGGAFTAVADDASALHYNPAGIALQSESSFLFGGELIVNPRRYTPITTDASGNPVRGADQDPHNDLNMVPTLGYTTHLPATGGIPSRLALGIGVWNTFGGSLTYDNPDKKPALDHTQTAVIEVVPGIGYEVNDFLAIGAAFRLGVGIFDVKATAMPADGAFSGTGLGAGATFGVMIRPTKTFNIGLVWRSALTTHISGSGTLQLDTTPGAAPSPVHITHDQEWPQAASVGVAWHPSPRLGVSAQADWTDWSNMQVLVIKFQESSNLDQRYPLDFNDSYAFHLGGEYRATDTLALRAGLTYDSQAVPDRTEQRQYLDGTKYGAAVGGGYAFTRHWRMDTAFEFIGGTVRVVPDNSKQLTMAGLGQLANIAPGEHEGQVYTFELQMQYQY